MATEDDVEKSFHDDLYIKDDERVMFVGDVFAVQKCRKLKVQIIFNASNMLVDDLFIIQHEKSTTNEERVKIEELIMEQNKSVTFNED